MHTVNIHEAKTHLSRLIEQAVRGEPFVIARAGKPLVQVTAIESQAAKPPRRIGFMANAIEVPADFDTMGAAEIAAMFDGSK